MKANKVTISNFFETSSVLTRLNTAYERATNEDFQKLWLKKWNQYAKENCNGALGERDFDTEKKFRKHSLNN
mgnify:CR=1 FL=1